MSAFLIKALAGIVVAVLIGFYFFHQSKAYILGPQINIITPLNGETLSHSYVLVKGQAMNISNLLVNGHTVLSGNLGNFETGLLLARGYNIIEISAKDKFGRTAGKKLEVVIK